MSLVGGPDRVLLVVTALVAFALLVRALGRHPRLGVLLLLAPGVLSALYVEPHAGLMIGQTSVHPEDIACAAALMVVAGRLVYQRALIPVPAVLLLAVVLTTGVLALVGAARFGIDGSFNEYRGIFYLFPPVLFVAVTLQTAADVDWLVRVWVLLAFVLSGIAVLHWLQYGLGNSQTLLLVNGVEQTGRGLPASGGLVVAQGALLLIFSRRPLAWSPLIRQLGATWLLIVVALLQHRTVWLLTVVTLIASLALDTNRFRRRQVGRTLAAATYGAVSLGIALATFGGHVAADFGRSWSEAFGPDSTLQWRLSGWTQLLRTNSGVFDWAFGHPFGAGYARVFHGETVTVPPHNFFVQLLLRGGVVAMVFLILAGISMWGRLLPTRSPSLALRLVLLTDLVFGLANEIDLSQGVVLGLCAVAPVALGWPAPAASALGAERPERAAAHLHRAIPTP